MSTVVQTVYKPQIIAATVGMIADEASADVMTRICETSAGIGFGLAVCLGTLSDKGAVLGGTTTGAFLGVSVRDVTLDRLPIDPLAADQSLIAADTYGQYSNMAVLTRGNIWVTCYGGGSAGVKSGDPLGYDTNGHFTNSAATQGTFSFGSTTFTQNPAVGDTLVVNGDTWTWASAITSGLQLLVGATLGDSIRMAATTLEASTSTNTTVMQYSYFPYSPAGAPEGSGANTLQYANETVGTGVFTITSSTTGATVTAMTAGVALSVAVVGGYWKTHAIAGQIAKISLGIQR